MKAGGVDHGMSWDKTVSYEAMHYQTRELMALKTGELILRQMFSPQSRHITI
jgi:hypothetical protein